MPPHVQTEMERTGGSPRLWLDRYLREKHISPDDRTGHELRHLTDILHSAGSFDQVNLGGLVCLERAARRIALIVDAHSNPSKPSYSNARYFMGYNLSEEVVSPALRAFVVRRAKEDYDVAQAQRRTDNRMEKFGADTQEGDGTGGDGPARGRGGRGRGGRGSGGGRTAPAPTAP